MPRQKQSNPKPLKQVTPTTSTSITPPKQQQAPEGSGKELDAVVEKPHETSGSEPQGPVPPPPRPDDAVSSSDEASVASVTSGARKKESSKTKIFTDLSPEQEEDMVEWLEANPVIYNRKLGAYKDSQKKMLLWNEKAEAIGKSVIELSTWYKSIRSRYGRILKKKSGDGVAELTERDLWIKTKFDFLKVHIYEVPKRTLRQLTSKRAASASASVDDDDDDDDSSVNVQPSQPPSTTPLLSVTGKSRAKSRKVHQDEDLPVASGERSSQSLQIQEKLVAVIPPTIPSERQAFADWTRSVMMELEPDVWRRFQREMTGLMTKFLDENDRRREQMAASSVPGPSRRHDSPSAMLQPPPGSWPTQHQPQISLWQSQSPEGIQQQPQHLTHRQPRLKQELDDEPN